MRALLLALCACAKTVDELAPIACVQNGLCPTGYQCVHDQCLTDVPCVVTEPGSCPADRPRCALMRTSDTTYGGQCVPQDATGAEGASCQILFNLYAASWTFPYADRTCAAKSMCYDFSVGQLGDGTGTASGKCRTLCSRDGDCGSGQKCLDAFSRKYLPGFTGPTTPVGVCIPSCTLFASGACTGGAECTLGLDVDGASAFGVCLPPGIAQEKDICNLVNPTCASGYACVPEGTSLACRKLCKPGGTPACTAPETCNTSILQVSGVGICR